MKLRSFRTFLVLLVPLLFILSFVGWNIQNQPKPAFSFNVNIPKAYNPNFTDEEFNKFCLNNADSIPISVFKKIERTCFVLPHSHTTLIVSIEKARNIKINSQEFGSLENIIPLTEKLHEIFNEREMNRVFEENSDKITKVVIVKAPHSAKYGDVVKVIDTVKSSGADPIVLQIDGLPE